MTKYLARVPWFFASVAVGLASCVATEMLAYAAPSRVLLGAPLLWWGQIPLYHPWACWAWAWQFGAQPWPLFRSAGLVWVGIVGLLAVLRWRAGQGGGTPRQVPEARWATWREL